MTDRRIVRLSRALDARRLLPRLREVLGLEDPRCDDAAPRRSDAADLHLLYALEADPATQSSTRLLREEGARTVAADIFRNWPHGLSPDVLHSLSLAWFRLPEGPEPNRHPVFGDRRLMAMRGLLHLRDARPQILVENAKPAVDHVEAHVEKALNDLLYVVIGPELEALSALEGGDGSEAVERAWTRTDALLRHAQQDGFAPATLSLLQERRKSAHRAAVRRLVKRIRPRAEALGHSLLVEEEAASSLFRDALDLAQSTEFTEELSSFVVQEATEAAWEHHKTDRDHVVRWILEPIAPFVADLTLRIENNTCWEFAAFAADYHVLIGQSLPLHVGNLDELNRQFTHFLEAHTISSIHRNAAVCLATGIFRWIIWSADSEVALRVPSAWPAPAKDRATPVEIFNSMLQKAQLLRPEHSLRKEAEAALTKIVEAKRK